MTVAATDEQMLEFCVELAYHKSCGFQADIISGSMACGEGTDGKEDSKLDENGHHPLLDGPVFFQVDQNTDLAALLIGDKLDSGHGFRRTLIPTSLPRRSPQLKQCIAVQIPIRSTS